jgi:hypothetical protein
MIDNQDSIRHHNEAPSSSTLAASVKAERAPRRSGKKLIRLKVDKSPLQAATTSKGRTKQRAIEPTKRGKKRKAGTMHNQERTELAIVLYQNSSSRRPPPAMLRVDLDNDTLRVHDALMKWDKSNTESFEGVDIGSGPEWDKIRQGFEILVHEFISTVRRLFGNYSYHCPIFVFSLYN